MSLCLVLETQDCVWIGADTAVSYNVNGKCLRGLGEVAEKVFNHANAVFFLCGSIYNASNIRSYIEKLPVITPNVINGIAAQMRIITAQGRPYTDKNVKTALIMVLLDNGRVYGINENNNFIVESPITPLLHGYRTICCVGVDNEYGAHGTALAEKYHSRIHGIPKLYEQVYSDLSCNGIGGSVDLYRLNVREQTVKKYHVPITEKGIEYIDVQEMIKSFAHATMTSGSISWNNVNSDPVATNAQSTANSAQSTANSASAAAQNAANNIQRLANGSYSGGTFIDGTSISAPYITGGRITGVEIIGGSIKSNTIIDVGTDIKLGSKIVLQSNNASIVNSGNCSIDFNGNVIRLSGMGDVDVHGVGFYNGTIKGVSTINGTDFSSLVARVAALEAAKA